MNAVSTIDRDKEVNNLAKLFLDWETNPKTLLDGDYPDINEETEKIKEVNDKFSLDISLAEVAKQMEVIILLKETKSRLRAQNSERKKATQRPLSRIPYRDWLAGMIFSSNQMIHSKTAVECADKLIAELYPIEGEIDENSGN